MSIIGALVLGSWINSPIWPNSQPPIDNNSVLSSSTSSAVPVIENTGTIPADRPTPTPPRDSVTSETPTVSQSETATPSETAQTSTLPTATETLAITPGSGSDPDDWAKLINSSPVDGFNFAPYNTFTYIWTIKNIGTTTWTTDYDLVFISGTKMTNKVVVPFSHNVKPGKTIELSLPLTAPKIPGTYQGFWMLGNKSGETFGIGDKADQPLKTKITVVNVDPNNSYDFLLNFCQADWWNSKGETVKCPGEPHQISGFVYFSTQPTLENGPSDKPVLWVHSNNTLEGIISGRYPAYNVM
ncbi:MAG: NBR1-Ig-like domain-containing protein, partial [Anaerolineales bacterium]|nr:NBR1-Ig-like domain-containing protein [Anaerolineales bacterium]